MTQTWTVAFQLKLFRDQIASQRAQSITESPIKFHQIEKILYNVPEMVVFPFRILSIYNRAIISTFELFAPAYAK